MSLSKLESNFLIRNLLPPAAPGGARPDQTTCCHWQLFNSYLSTLAGGKANRAGVCPLNDTTKTARPLHGEPLKPAPSRHGAAPRPHAHCLRQPPGQDTHSPEVIDLSVGRRLAEPSSAGCPVDSGRSAENSATNSDERVSTTRRQRQRPTRARRDPPAGQPDRARRTRTMFSDWQLGELEWRFSRNKYLITSDRHRVANLLNLDQLQVKTWFQNRRMKWKKQILASGLGLRSPTKPKGRPKRDSIPPIDDD